MPTAGVVGGTVRARQQIGLPATDNFQHWPPWRPLVVETARRVLDYTGGTLVVPMTVLVEAYWQEISTGLTRHGIPVRHFVLHACQGTLRERIMGDALLGPSPFRLGYLEQYAEAARTWLHEVAEVLDTTHLTPARAAQQIAQSVVAEPSAPPAPATEIGTIYDELPERDGSAGHDGDHRGLLRCRQV